MKSIGRIVAHRRDRYGTIEVREDPAGTRRTLHFGNDIEQSRYYLHAPDNPGFEYLQIALDRLRTLAPDHLLTLGLGGGRLNTCLYHLIPTCHQTVIELRPDVVGLAREWFHLPDAIDVHVTDAFFFVQTLPPRSEQAIFIDLFTADGMPAQFASDAFLEPLWQALRPGGRLLMNLWRHDDAVRHLLIPWFQRQLDGHFELYPVLASPNWVLEAVRHA